jgi:hypothetical protein
MLCGMTQETHPLRNYEDTTGLPICVVCGQAIHPQDSTGRPDGCIVHARCMPEALAEPVPCDPKQQ